MPKNASVITVGTVSTVITLTPTPFRLTAATHRKPSIQSASADGPRNIPGGGIMRCGPIRHADVQTLTALPFRSTLTVGWFCQAVRTIPKIATPEQMIAGLQAEKRGDLKQYRQTETVQ